MQENPELPIRKYLFLFGVGILLLLIVAAIEYPFLPNVPDYLELLFLFALVLSGVGLIRLASYYPPPKNAFILLGSGFLFLVIWGTIGYAFLPNASDLLILLFLFGWILIVICLIGVASHYQIPIDYYWD